MDNTLQNKPEPISLEELVTRYKNDRDIGCFEEIFTRCHRDLLRFLLAKKMSVDDAEDLLQDYFINDFDRSVESYDPDRGKKFINYISNIVLLRFFSFYKKNKREEEVRDFALDNALPHKEYQLATRATKHPEAYQPTLLMKDEIKDFFRDAVLSISNQNHRNAVIMKLCIPIKISAEEAGEILACSKSSYTTWLYRGTLDLQAIFEERQESMPFDLQEALRFVMEDSFTIKNQALNEIQDDISRDLLKGYLFEKKNQSILSEEKGLPRDEVKNLIWKGLFELLNLLNKPELLFRTGGDMMIERDNVLDYLDSLDDNMTGAQQDFKTRSSVSTGDRSLDELLYTVHRLFKQEYSENNGLSLKDEFLRKTQAENLSIAEVAERYAIPEEEIRKLLMRGNTVTAEAKQKIYQFIGRDIHEGEPGFKGDEKEFEKLNMRLLKMYYEKKKQ